MSSKVSVLVVEVCPPPPLPVLKSPRMIHLSLMAVVPIICPGPCRNLPCLCFDLWELVHRTMVIYQDLLTGKWNFQKLSFIPVGRVEMFFNRTVLIAKPILWVLLSECGLAALNCHHSISEAEYFFSEWTDVVAFSWVGMILRSKTGALWMADA